MAMAMRFLLMLPLYPSCCIQSLFHVFFIVILIVFWAMVYVFSCGVLDRLRV